MATQNCFQFHLFILFAIHPPALSFVCLQKGNPLCIRRFSTNQHDPDINQNVLSTFSRTRVLPKCKMCLENPDPSKRQAYQDVALRGLVEVGQRVPSQWKLGNEFEFSDISTFQANEIVVVKRPDGSFRFGRIELTSSATTADDLVELGRGGVSTRSIHVVEIERGLLGSRQYRSPPRFP